MALGLDWINFAGLRRSHSTLHQERGTDPKIIADQQGHGLGVHLSDYVDSSVTRKREAVAALWSDFKALRSELSAVNGTNETRADLRGVQVIEKMERETGLEPATSTWENERRLKIKDNGVYGGEYRCMEISNFRYSAAKIAP
jgi:hypothetical protein